MKKLILTLSLAVPFYFSSFAQWVPVNGTGNYYLNSGRVGIGTTNPYWALEVIGNDTPFSISNSSLSGTSTTGETSIYFGDSGSGVNMLRASKRSYNTRAFEIWTEYGFNTPFKAADFHYNTLNLFTANTNRLTINSIGNVGIGTTSPPYKLSVKAGTSVIYLESTNSTAGTPIGYFYDTGRGVETVISSTDNLTNGTYLASYSNTPLMFGANAALSPTAKMTILPSGNVGIGTGSPNEKLTVNGTIHSTEVKVTPTVPVPDYVFEPDYNLRSLEELKSYVDANHHLPEIPSAKEIEKNGIVLGDMNMKLLKKVEELTLYLIEKDKQLGEQQKNNQSQQQQIDELKQELTSLTKALTKN